MKTRIIIFVILASFVLESCHRAMTPYEAATNPRGRKCRAIR